MNDVVVDSSVVAKWILPEADSDQADRLLADVVSEGGRLIVLEIGVAEVGNAIWKRHHRGLASPADVRRFLASLLGSPVHVEPITPLLASAMEIAMKFDRAVYDALFVAATRHLKVTGTTADEPLYQAVHGDFPEIVLLRDWQKQAVAGP
jgi:predicted nucleic acid-binding protein